MNHKKVRANFGTPQEFAKFRSERASVLWFLLPTAIGLISGWLILLGGAIAYIVLRKSNPATGSFVGEFSFFQWAIVMVIFDATSFAASIATIVVLVVSGIAATAAAGFYRSGFKSEFAYGPTLVPPSSVANSTSASSSDLNRVAKLKSLLDSGVITKEDFDYQKGLIFHPQGVPPPQATNELAKLKTLLQSGAITATEYEDLRRKALNRLMEAQVP